ncbi:hypothetical protein NEUTE2DRAFT_131988 [Neurospora tetrasperma FGSC 2509]|nr:hypothetical protein NEUTE2DRAFT_131988 [Neurospora tetrasperma FGSC 2509]
MPVKVPGRPVFYKIRNRNQKPRAKTDGLSAVIHNNTLSKMNNSTTYWPCSLFEFDDPVLCELLDVLTLPRENNMMLIASKVVHGVAQRPGCSASHVPGEVRLSHAAMAWLAWVGRQLKVVGCEETYCRERNRPTRPGPLAVIRDPPGELGFGGADDAAVDQFQNISTR